MLTKKIKLLIYLLPYLVVFLYSYSYSFDPDLGWHLKYGEYFLTHHQILRENIYSSTMTSYHWANAGWLSDIIIYSVFSKFNFIGLSVAGGLVTAATFYIYGKINDLTFFQKLPLFSLVAYLITPIRESSLRGQQLSLLLLGVLLLLLSLISRHYIKSTKFVKINLLIPLLFWFWINLHQESFLGLGVFFLWTLISLFQNRNEFKHLSVVFGLTILFTFVNPFGYQIYLVALSHIGDPLLKNVNEYIPFKLFSMNWFKLVGVSVFAVCGVVYLSKKNHIKNISRISVILLVLLALSFFIRRFSWPSYYILIPFSALIIPRKIKQNRYKLAIVLFFSICWILVIGGRIEKFGDGPENWNNYCKHQSVPCSPASADFIEKNLKAAKIYTYYDWGGWLIWNYPKIKPSVDGRMHLWRDSNGYSATEEQWKIENGARSIESTDYNAVFVPLSENPLYFELNRLMYSRKWRLVYEDNYSAVVVKEESKNKN